MRFKFLNSLIEVHAYVISVIFVAFLQLLKRAVTLQRNVTRSDGETPAAHTRSAFHEMLNREACLMDEETWTEYQATMFQALMDFKAKMSQKRHQQLQQQQNQQQQQWPTYCYYQPPISSSSPVATHPPPHGWMFGQQRQQLMYDWTPQSSLHTLLPMQASQSSYVPMHVSSRYATSASMTPAFTSMATTGSIIGQAWQMACSDRPTTGITSNLSGMEDWSFSGSLSGLLPLESPLRNPPITAAEATDAVPD